jgi:hypothetical protein
MADSEHAFLTRENIIAFAVLALVLLGGAWLFRDLKQSGALLDCLSPDRRDCGLEISIVPGR